MMNSIEVYSSTANGIPQSAHMSASVSRIRRGIYQH